MDEMISDPGAYRYMVTRNAAIDAWRRRQAAARSDAAWPAYVAAAKRAYLHNATLVRARDHAVSLLDQCPLSGAGDYAAYLADGTAPESHDPARVCWDKRVQRARRWTRARLPADESLVLARGRGAPLARPTLRAVIMRQRRDKR